MAVFGAKEILNIYNSEIVAIEGNTSAGLEAIIERLPSQGLPPEGHSARALRQIELLGQSADPLSSMEDRAVLLVSISLYFLDQLYPENADVEYAAVLEVHDFVWEVLGLIPINGFEVDGPVIAALHCIYVEVCAQVGDQRAAISAFDSLINTVVSVLDVRTAESDKGRLFTPVVFRNLFDFALTTMVNTFLILEDRDLADKLKVLNSLFSGYRKLDQSGFLPSYKALVVDRLHHCYKRETTVAESCAVMSALVAGPQPQLDYLRLSTLQSPEVDRYFLYYAHAHSALYASDEETRSQFVHDMASAIQELATGSTDQGRLHDIAVLISLVGLVAVQTTDEAVFEEAFITLEMCFTGRSEHLMLENLTPEFSKLILNAVFQCIINIEVHANLESARDAAYNLGFTNYSPNSELLPDSPSSVFRPVSMDRQATGCLMACSNLADILESVSLVAIDQTIILGLSEAAAEFQSLVSGAFDENGPRCNLDVDADYWRKISQIVDPIAPNRSSLDYAADIHLLP